ncbi:MAG: methylated-DNA--[protein]-cysteine S-methyltransferase [Candidatus Dormibacteraceae bacterium]
MSRSLEHSIRGLGGAAPPTLLPSVLQRVGLGFWYGSWRSILGPMFVAYGPAGLVAIRPAGEPAAFEGWFGSWQGRSVRPVDPLPERLAARIAASLKGNRGRIEVDLRALTGFQRDVLGAARRIPRGEVRTYGWVAREIGRPGAVRAVGSALARNPIPLVIPCHRVLRGDWQVGEYSCGGPAAKRTVLAAEGLGPESLEELSRGGVRFHGSDTTRIFCLPTCRHARRTQPRHRVAFRSEADARRAGYRPCPVCRPVLARPQVGGQGGESRPSRLGPRG